MKPGISAITAISFLALGLCGTAWGHLDTAGFGANGVPTSFSIQPEGPYLVGDTATITFVVAMSHDPTAAIAFSKDNGLTWESPDTMAISSAGTKTFKWIVPANSATSQGKIRVSYPATWVGNTTDVSNIISKSFIVQDGLPASTFRVKPKGLSDRQSAGFPFLSGLGLNGNSMIDILGRVYNRP